MNNRVSITVALLTASVLLLYAISIASSDRFRIGVIDDMTDPIDLNVVDDRLTLWIDSFHCDMGHIQICNPEKAELLTNRGMRVLIAEKRTSASQRGSFARDSYQCWQTDSASFPEWWDGAWVWVQGRKYIHASGDTSWMVSETNNNPGTVLIGPIGYFERHKSIKSRQNNYILKVQNVPADSAVLTLYVIWGYTDTVADTTLYGDDFDGDWGLHTLEWQQIPPPPPGSGHMVSFPIYWHGIGTVYVDYIDLLSTRGPFVLAGYYDDEIKDNSEELLYGLADSLVYAWLVGHEDISLNNHRVVKHVHDVLKTAAGHAPSLSYGASAEDAYLFITQPEIHVHYVYPFYDRVTNYSSEPSSPDSVSLQYAFDSRIYYLKSIRQRINQYVENRCELVAKVQVCGFPCSADTFGTLRVPSVEEVRATVNLCLAYDIDGISYFVGYSTSLDSNGCYVRGLLDIDSEPYPIFDSMAIMVQPFLDSLGDKFYDLKLVDAGPSENAANMEKSFINEIISGSYPDSPFVEVAFFQDPTVVDPEHGKYFFLVNRRCLPEESQIVAVYFSGLGYDDYIVDQYSYDSFWVDYDMGCLVPRVTVTLEPGQGKLFHMPPRGLVALPVVDSLQCIDGSELATAGNGYMAEDGSSRYFCLENSGVSTQQVRVWLNEAMMDFGSAEMYYIVDSTTGQKVAVTGPMPEADTNDVPFTFDVPPDDCLFFKVLPINTSGNGFTDSDSLPDQWEGGLLFAERTINVGTTVQVYGPAAIQIKGSGRIEVSGTLKAEGMAGYPARFISAADPPNPNDWDWIKVNAGGTLDLDYCQVKHAYKGIWAESDRNDPDSTLTVKINHSEFDDIDVCGIEFNTHHGSDLDVLNSTIKDCGTYGIRVISGMATIKDNDFLDPSPYMYACLFGGDVNYTIGGVVENNTFESSSYWALTLSTLNHSDVGEGVFEARFNEFELSISSDIHGAIQAYNCHDEIELHRNRICNSGVPRHGYGILNFSTPAIITGNRSLVKDSSEIKGWMYGLACYGMYSGDPGYPTVREVAFTELNDDYDVWVDSDSDCDLGTGQSWGYNYLYAYHHVENTWTVYNTNPSQTVSAIKNYWDVDPPPMTYGLVDASMPLDSSPFASGRGGGFEFERRAVNDPIPQVANLEQNYPNPFNLETQIQFSLQKSSRVSISVYNILGQRIRDVIDDDLPAGNHQVSWDGRDNYGAMVATGIYFYHIEADDLVETKKMMLVK